MKLIIKKTTFLILSLLFSYNYILAQTVTGYEQELRNVTADLVNTAYGGFARLYNSPTADSIGISIYDSRDNRVKEIAFRFLGLHNTERACNFLYTRNKGYLITSIVYASMFNTYAYIYTELDSTGRSIWSKEMHQDQSFVNQTVSTIQTTGERFISYATYRSQSGTTGILMGFDGTGQVIFKKRIDRGRGVLVPTHDNGFILFDEFGKAAKFTHTGILVWSYTYTNTTPSTRIAIHNATRTHDNGFAVTGYFSTSPSTTISPFLLQINEQGIPQWAKVYLPNATYFEAGHEVLQTKDLGYIFLANDSSYRANIIKTDSLGNIEWANTHRVNTASGTSTRDFSSIIFGYQYGYRVAVGYYNNGVKEPYMIKTDDRGVTGCETPRSYTAQDITVTSTNDTLPITNASFDMNPYPLRRGSMYVNEMTICQSSNPSSVENLNNNHNLSIYPNPANDVLNITYEIDRPAEILVEITDLQGKCIHSETWDHKGKQENIRLDTSELVGGMYMVLIKHGQQASTQKLVIY